MNELTPTRLAEKIKQLLSGGVELEQIQSMALKQGVDPIIFSEALDIIQGKVTESMEEAKEETALVATDLKKWIFIGLGGLSIIVVLFFAYVLWSKNTVPDLVTEVDNTPTTEVAVPESQPEVDNTVTEALDFIAELESDDDIVDDEFLDSLSDDFSLSDVTIIEDTSSRGSQLFSEEETPLTEEETQIEDDMLVAEIELGRFEIVGLPRTIKPREEYEFQVIAYDTDDNVIENYSQEVEFRSTARSISIEPYYEFQPSDKGVADRTVAFNSLGKHTLAVNVRGDASKRAQVTLRVRD